MTDLATTQLLVFRFRAGAAFEGEMLGALERLGPGTSLQVRDVLFARKDADTGELEVLAGGDDSAGHLTAAAIEFRLDDSSRRKSSAHALQANPELAQLADTLEPGAALAALLVEHRWLAVLGDAVDRIGGAPARSEFTAATQLRELLPDLVD